MPINLDQQATVPGKAQKSIYIAKFFGEHLTGAGKKIGLLNDTTNPMYISAKHCTSDLNINCPKQVMTAGDTKTITTPVNIFQPNAWAYMRELPLNLAALKQETNISADPNLEIYLEMDMHSIITSEKQIGDVKDRTVNPCFHVKLSIINTPKIDTIHQIGKGFLTRKTQNNLLSEFTCNPIVILNDWEQALTSAGYQIDKNLYQDFINDYDTFSGMCKQSERWQTTIVNDMAILFANIKSPNNNSNDALNTLALQLRYLENYNIPLQLYRDLYQDLVKIFTKDEVKIFCKQNLNLLLSDTLHMLDQNKANLSKIPKPSTKHCPKKKFSKEQIDALTSIDPLILVQAGAGTGKSTVILGRIDYLIDSGVNPKDITVLSFTNAAANNIKVKQPNVNSMTISYMVHSIYTLNFPAHALSSIQTIANSLDIYFPKQPLAKEFAKLLTMIMDSKPDGFTKMNNFIELNYNDVILMLDRLKQTCLELEIIICYQQIENFKEPLEVASKFLIIDEVQDNSIFDFIYTLKYTEKHAEALFIVGDCSQTLYEFRASNPRALNVLEGSGVFTTYQLKVNYRSNQEILDFANIALQNIEANQYAKIQLQANSLSKITEKSFREKVTLDYKRLSKMSEFRESLSVIIATNVKPYIDDKLKKGEQIAFLAFARKDIMIMEEELKKMYPKLNIVNLIPDRSMGSTVFSNFIRKYWDEVKFIPTDDIAMIITQMVIAHLGDIVYNSDKMLLPTQRMLENWRNENNTGIQSWQMQYNAGHIQLNQVLDNLKDCMLAYEIRTNSIKQALLSSRNEESKKADKIANANILLSTIHSAKGLEFQNVVALYKNDNHMNEANKRMYYVEFTRAMNTEYILAYDTKANPKIEADYNTIIKALEFKDQLKTIPGSPTVQPKNGTTN